MLRHARRKSESGRQTPARSHHAGRSLVLAFLIPIFIGGLLLKLPASASEEAVGWSTAYFTATSAVTVTGLAVVDTATTFSKFGQIVILTLIQIGGLGYMVASSLMLLLFRHEPTLHERLLLKESVGAITLKDTITLAWSALRFALVIEAIGAVILTTRFVLDPQYDFSSAAWRGVFHAVSAFCNAGFDIFGQDGRGSSLIGFRDDPVVNFTVMALIVIGGLGFVVCQELMTRWRTRGRSLRGHSRRLTLHSRIVLIMTAGLIALGTLSFLATEWSNPNTLAAMPLGERMLVSLFQSVTFRTAGFATVDFGELRSITLLIAGFFMFVGASPGGTGGGIKTTTFAAILIATQSSMRGLSDAELFNRRLDRTLIYRALMLLVIAFAVMVAAMVMLNFTETAALVQAGQSENLFVRIQFEVLSALGTVGLSTGITPYLTEAGRGIIMALMFLGRLGPMTVAAAFTQRAANRKFRLPTEKVALG